MEYKFGVLVFARKGILIDAVSIHLAKRCMSLEHFDHLASVYQDMLISGMSLGQWLLCLAFWELPDFV